MSAKTVRNALGLLQDDPDNRDALGELERALGFDAEQSTARLSGELGAETADIVRLLESARHAHERRRELETAYRLLAIETALRDDRSQALSDLLRFAEFELLDDREVARVAAMVLAIDPEDASAKGAQARAAERASSWQTSSLALAEEAGRSDDANLRAALFARAADLVFRYARPRPASSDAAPPSMSAPVVAVPGKGKKRKKKVDANLPAEPSGVPSTRVGEWLEQALAADPNNRAALALYLRTLDLEDRSSELARALAAAANRTAAKSDRVQYLLQSARVFEKRLAEVEQASDLYSQVLDLVPGHAEATSALVDYFTASEQWEHLVTLYEDQVSAHAVPQGEELGVQFQIAMIRWRMQNKLEQAAVAFEKVRRLEPTHPGMLNFFREWAETTGDKSRLAQVIQDAWRALPDGEEKMKVGQELAHLAEETDNAQKAIEQYRGVLRQDPSNQGARDALRRLYKQTGATNALVDLLRGELDRLGADAVDERVRMLQEIAEVYRTQTKSDSALVSVLSQLSQILPEDKDVLRELVRTYENLGRHRDVLLAQQKLAVLEEDDDVRAEIYRVVARKWLEQFTNVQSAIETYERLRELRPRDVEARDTLRELYTKRRAYRPLAELLRVEIDLAETPEEKKSTMLELARLSAERLDQGKEAVRLYKRLYDEFPDDERAFDALEKLAERERDFETVAEVLERRATAPGDEGLQALQKLAAVYTERLGDNARAKDTWQRVLERQPGHPKALRLLRDLLLAAKDYDGLERVYESTGELEALVEVFSTAADRASEKEQKIELSLRVAALCENKLGVPERAFRAYERILSVKPNDERAARALIPLYEHDGRHARALPLYEVLVHAAETDAEKVALYGRMRQVAEADLKDGEAAMRFARLAYELEPSESNLDALASTAALAGDFVNFAAAIEGRVQDENTPASERRQLRKRLAELARERGRVDDALAAYKTLLREDESDEGVVQRLDTLLRESGKADELRELFDLRVGRANTSKKVQLLEEWAELEEEAFLAKAEASRVYERLLEIVPEHGGALRALSRLYSELGDGEGALRVLERDRDTRQGTERADREGEIAHVLLDRLERPVRALDAVKRALTLVPGHSGAIAVLERLLPRPETRADASHLLELHYDETGDLDKQVGVLEVAIATRASKNDRMHLYAKLGNVHERRGNMEASFDVLARAIDEYPGELEIWEIFEGLARSTRRVPEAAERLEKMLGQGAGALPDHVRTELLRRGARFFEEDLGDIDRARPYLEALHARHPEDRAVFERLKQVLSTRERWDDLVRLYDQQVEVAEDAASKVDLLEEAALVCEEMRGDAESAARYYEAIAALDPAHEHASRALEKLHREAGRHADLARVLELRLEHATTPSTDVRLELARLHLGPLDDKRKALGYLDAVLDADPHATEARGLLEGLLQEPALRADVATILERVYGARDDARSLVGVLEVRLEAAEGEERIELLRQVAQLRDERLTDDAGAFAAYGRLLPLVADDAEVRESLTAISRRLGNTEALAKVLEETLTSPSIGDQAAQVAFELGGLYENQLGDPSRAAASYERARTAAPSGDPLVGDSLRALDRLYTASGRTDDLHRVLELSAANDDFAEVRGALHRRMGVLARDARNEPAAAVAAFELALLEDDADLEALQALGALYEATSANEKLAENLRRREGLADDGDQRRTLGLELARVLAERLAAVPEAIDQYRAVAADFGATDAILAKLIELYELAERWDDLAEAHEERARLAADDAQRANSLLAAGLVRKDKLDDASGALDVLRDALALDPRHEASRAAVESLTQHPEVGRQAAETLVPLYEASGDRQKLLAMIEVELGLVDDLDEKLERLERATTVAELELGDPQRAFGYAARAAELAMDEPAYPGLAERLERLATRTESFSALAQVYQRVADATVDEERRVETLLRLALLQANELNDAAAARLSYERASELRPEDSRPLEALERLLEAAGDHPALATVLARRAELAEEPSMAKGLRFKHARLLRTQLADNAQAIVVYEAILDEGFDREAAAELAALYVAQERYADLVALHERELGEDDTSAARRAELHIALGHLFETSLEDADRALDAYEAALALEPLNDAARLAIEGLLGNADLAERAAEALEPVYLQQRDWKKLAGSLEARVGASHDPSQRIELLRRLAVLHEEQEENYAAALEAMGRVLREDLRDRAVWTELTRLARVAGAEARLAELYAAELQKVDSDDDDTAALAEITGRLFLALEQPSLALEHFRRHLAFAPEEARSSFEAIDGIYRDTRRHAERAALHRDSLGYRDEPRERLETLHVIAELEENELRDPNGAIETYRSCLDVDETDRVATDALERLLRGQKRYAELADLLRRVAESASDPRNEARARLELGSLLRGELDDTNDAIAHYERVLELFSLDGPGQDAARALESMLPKADPSSVIDDVEQAARILEILEPAYDRADAWEKRIELASVRERLAGDAQDRVQILRERSKILEERAGDREAAFGALEEAFVLDPEDGETREELERMAAATERWDDLAQAYERGLSELSDELGRRELLLALATLHDQRRDDPRAALVAYERVLGTDESDLDVLGKLDELATLLSDWDALVRVLGKQVDALVADDERASLLRRIGETKRDMIENPAGAIEAYERALELEPDSAFTVDQLIDLYQEDGKQPERLAALYKQRVELAEADELAETDERNKTMFDALVAAARVYEGELADPREAIELYRRAAEIEPRELAVLARLEALYAAERMTPELLENLRMQRGISSEPDARRALLLRIAELLQGDAGEPAEAVDAYRELLVERYEDSVVARLFHIAEQNEELREPVAELLQPHLEERTASTELVLVLGWRFAAASDPEVRLELAFAMARAQESGANDAEAAFATLLQQVAESPASERLHAELERLAMRNGKDAVTRYVDLLAKEAESLFDAEIAKALSEREAELARRELGDAARAAVALRRALEQGGDDVRVLATLAELYRGLGDTAQVAEVLELRAELESDDATVADIQAELGALFAEQDSGRALASYRVALERVPSHAPSRRGLESLIDAVSEGRSSASDPAALFDELFETLEALYAEVDDADARVALHDRRIRRAGDREERIRARLDLAEVVKDDANRQQRVLEDALLEDPSHLDVQDALDQVVTRTGDAAGAAKAYERALEAGADLPVDVRAQLWRRTGERFRDAVGDAAAAERAFVQAVALDGDDLDGLSALVELRRAAGREAELLESLRARARVLGDPASKEADYTEALRLAEAQDVELAEAVLREALASNEGWLFGLDELLRLRANADDAPELHLRRAELSGDDEARSHRLQAADKLLAQGHKARAIALYEELTADDPVGGEAPVRLRAAYEADGMTRELGKLLVQQIDAATSAEQRSGLRVELAKLQLEAFGAPEDAADSLRAVLDEEPRHTEALLALSAVYESLGKHDELVELLQRELERARDEGDRHTQLRLLGRMGHLYEEQLADPAQALAKFTEILTLDEAVGVPFDALLAEHRDAVLAAARLAEASQAWDLAERALAEIVERGHEVPTHALRLAEARKKQGNVQGAVLALRQALAAEPSQADARRELLALLRSENSDELVQALLDEAELRRGEAGEAIPATGSIVPRQGPVADVLALYREAASLHAKAGRGVEAAEVLERASRVVPENRELLLELCDAYTASGRASEATTVLERIIESFGGKRTRELSVYHHKLGRALVGQGDKERALGEYDTAFKMDPSNVGVLRDLGALAFETGDYARADKSFRALMLQKLDGDSGITKGEVFQFLGEIAEKTGDTGRATQMYQRAVDNDSSLTVAKERLAALKK